MNVVTMHAPVTDSKDELFHSGKIESVAPSASLRVSRISASLGDESPEGWLCYVEGKSMCGLAGKHLDMSRFAEYV